ncbi:hypothetical protein PV325_003939, partial [Microctonus aethiopoides]
HIDEDLESSLTSISTDVSSNNSTKINSKNSHAIVSITTRQPPIVVTLDDKHTPWNENIEFHTYQRKEDRKSKIILKGLPRISTDEIHEELINHTINPLNIQLLRSKANNNVNTATYLITKYGHGSQNCFKTPNCLKCACKHSTLNFDVKEETAFKCVNCEGDHKARQNSNITHHQSEHPHNNVPIHFKASSYAAAVRSHRPLEEKQQSSFNIYKQTSPQCDCVASEVNNIKTIHTKNSLRCAVSELTECSSEVLDKIIEVIKLLKSIVCNETAFKNISDISKIAHDQSIIDKIKSNKACDNEVKSKADRNADNTGGGVAIVVNRRLSSVTTPYTTNNDKIKTIEILAVKINDVVIIGTSRIACDAADFKRTTKNVRQIGELNFQSQKFEFAVELEDTSVSASTDFEKNDKNDNGDKPVKMYKAEYNRQYRTPVPTAPLTQLSPDAGPTIKQHEAVTVYNSVNKKVRDVIDFLHESLLAYTKGGLRRVQFLKKELNLEIVSGNTLGTTRHGTSIRIFSRYVNHVTSDFHVSHFSYQKPIVTVINNDITFDEINNVQDDFTIEENQLSI